MSADGRSQDVDERGRQAAVALRRSVAAVHPGRDLAQRGTWVRPVLAIVALVAVGAVVAAVALAVGFGDEEESTLVTDSPPEARPMALTEVPDGLELIQADGIDARELEADPPGQTQTIHLYGDPDAEDPFADDDLAVSVIRSDAPGDGEGTALDDVDRRYGLAEEDGEVVEVRGVEGVVHSSWTLAPALAVSWIEQEVLVQVASHSLDEDALLELAEGLDLSDLDAPVPSALPSNLEPVGTAEPGLSGGAGWGDGLVAYSLSYMEQPPPSPETVSGQMPAGGPVPTSLSIFGFRASADGLLAARWSAGGVGRDIEIRGHSGIVVENESRSSTTSAGGPSGGAAVGDDTSAQLITLFWVEDGLVVQVDAVGLEVEEVLASAESLEPLDDEAWEELRDQFDFGLEADLNGDRDLHGDQVELGTGELDGQPWALVLEEASEDGIDLCLELGTISNCMGYWPAEEVTAVTGLAGLASSTDGRLLFGVVGVDVVEVATLVDGEPYERNHTVADPDGRPLRYFVVGAPDTSYEIVAYGEQGEEIERTAGDFFLPFDTGAFPEVPDVEPLGP